MDKITAIVEKIKLFAEWFFDWFILPYLPKGKHEKDDK